MPQIGGMIMDRLVTVFQNSAMYQLTYKQQNIAARPWIRIWFVPFSYLIVLLTPIKGCCCVSPVTIILGVKVQWRHFSADALCFTQFSTQVCQCCCLLSGPSLSICTPLLSEPVGKPCNVEEESLSTLVELLVFQGDAAFHNTRSPPWTEIKGSRPNIIPISGSKFSLQICASKHGESL